jgi:hypothetical protein
MCGQLARLRESKCSHRRCSCMHSRGNIEQTWQSRCLFHIARHCAATRHKRIESAVDDGIESGTRLGAMPQPPGFRQVLSGWTFHLLHSVHEGLGHYAQVVVLNAFDADDCHIAMRRSKQLGHDHAVLLTVVVWMQFTHDTLAVASISFPVSILLQHAQRIVGS